MKKNYNILSGYSWYVPDVRGLVILVLWFLLGALLGNVVTGVIAIVAGSEFAMSYGMIIGYPLMFIPAMIYASLKSKSASFYKDGVALDSRHFGKMGGALCALLAALATVAAGYVTDGISSVLPQMPEYLKKLLQGMVSGNFWVNFLLVSIFAPLFEEWLCRGVVLRSLLNYRRSGRRGPDGTVSEERKGIAPVWAIVISAVFFALIHGNLWQALPAFVLGCLFGFVYYRTGSLKLTMLMHCVNNTVSLLLSRVDSLEEVESWMQLLPGRQYWIIFAAAVLLIALIVRAFQRIPLQEVSGNCDSVDLTDI